MKNKEWIEEQVAEIMLNDGPDGHTDGADVIADFIEALLNDREDAWSAAYEIRCAEKDRQYQEWLEKQK